MSNGEAPTYITVNAREYVLTEPWKPIETAPKDGSSVLLYEEMEPVMCQGWWDGEEWRPSHGSSFFQQPTQWKPLPRAPR